MIDPWVHEIARQRHQDLLARAERYRLARSARDADTRRRTASCTTFAPLFKRRPKERLQAEV
jgi:hypothetical protein